MQISDERSEMLVSLEHDRLVRLHLRIVRDAPRQRRARLGAWPSRRSSTRRCRGRRRCARARPGDARHAGPASSARCTSPPRPSASSASTWPAGRRTWRRFDYKPQAGRDARPADARVVHQGPADRPAPGRRSSTASRRSTRSRKFGKSGQEISEIFPHIGSRRRRHLHRPLDEDRGDQPRPGPHVHEHRHDDLRPAGMGSWLYYGLGSDADDLPGFVVLTSTGRFGQIAADRRSGSGTAGFLPSRFQGVHFRGTGDPVLYLTQPAGRRPRPAARRRRRRAGAQPPARRRRRRSRRSPRASPSTRWRSACRRACRS